MRVFMAMATLAVVVGGCASADWPFNGSASLLARADRLADRQQYEPALRTYDEFLARYPTDPAAPRAQKSRDTIASIVTARVELARLRSELAARDGELARLRSELAALDGELARLRQETERLRADLEKLKEVDLNLERKKR
jgi:chromosome segregation ATPase